jgi:predicted dinucleotide-binding enzyme
MNIAVLGTGVTGKTLAAALAKHDFDVSLGTRDPQKEELVSWRDQDAPAVNLETFAEAVTNADLSILAIGWKHLGSAIDIIAQGETKDKIIIDLTNPLRFGLPQLELETDVKTSAGEFVQNKLPQAHIVKAFNIVAADQMISPHVEEGTPDMFIAGNNAAAKETVTNFLHQIGWRVVDTGDIRMSRAIEAMALVTIQYAVDNKSRSHALSLLRK